MELNRATITGQPFPQAADGYDRDAVDRHLEAIAEALPSGSEPVVTEAAEEMRSIVEGAEQSARALRATAEREAEELREAARLEAAAIREKAAREAADQVPAARAAVTSLLERVEALGLGIDDSRHHVMRAAEAMAERLSADSEPLVATLRERASALGAELDLIGSGLAAKAVEAASEREQPHDPAPEVGTGLAAEDLEDAARALADEPAAEADGEPAAEADDEPAAEADGAVSPGSERARLVALELAVTGTPRAEADRHLREELSIDDPRPILDEVYSRAERDD